MPRNLGDGAIKFRLKTIQCWSLVSINITYYIFSYFFKTITFFKHVDVAPFPARTDFTFNSPKLSNHSILALPVILPGLGYDRLAAGALCDAGATWVLHAGL